MRRNPIIAYTYEGDLHCVACTRAHAAQGRFTLPPVPLTGALSSIDEHDVPVDAIDREGYPVHPVFLTDEVGHTDEETGRYLGAFCGDCGAVIRSPEQEEEEEEEDEAVGALTLADLQAEYRPTAGSDPWGQCLGWHFAVCAELSRRGVAIPDAWQYREGAGGTPPRETYEDEVVADAHTEALLAFGHKLHRLAGILRAAGRDY